MDNGKGGDYVSLIGGTSNSLETTYTIASGITSGTMYRFRYRSKNSNGYSSWSPVTYITAAAVPSRPSTPTFVTATASSITISVSPSTNDNGSELTAINLYRNLGGTSTSYTLVSSLDISTTSYTLTTLADGIVAGTIYKFKTTS